MRSEEKPTMRERKLKNIPLPLQKIQVVEESTEGQDTNSQKKCGSCHETYPASKYIHSTKVDPKTFTKFSKGFYQALVYSVNSLRGPDPCLLEQKTVILPQTAVLKDKVLLLDLDQTLVHVSSSTKTSGDFLLTVAGVKRWVNIRPYCFQFLKNMSKIYNIYIFTASTLEYCQPIVNFLNKGLKTIQGILHRENCLETNHGFYIKDLRILKGIDLSKVILVDNLVHSFGLQLDNGIPILEFVNNKNDMELKGIQKILVRASHVEDVRNFLSGFLAIKKNLQLSEQEFIRYPDHS